MTNEQQRAAFEAQIELPPLPKPDQYIWYSRNLVESIRDRAVQVAIAQDRQSRGEPVKPRPELLQLAEDSGAVITGKPDASEPITIVFSIQAWRAFDAALSLQPADPVNSSPVNWHDAQQITDLPEVDELLRDFADDPTGDAGTMIVRAVMQAVRFPAEPVKGPSDWEGQILSEMERRFALRGEENQYERLRIDDTQLGVEFAIERMRALLDRYGNAAQLAESLHLQDLRNSIAQCSELRQQLNLMEEHARGEVWRWQSEGGNDLASMGNRMGVLIYACDLQALLAQPAASAEPFCYVSINKHGDVTRTTKRRDKWSKVPLYTAPVAAQPNHIGGAAEMVSAQSSAPAGEITASEAVYGFAAWLTTRDQAVTFSATHDAAPAADLVAQFVSNQGLTQPRENYAQRLNVLPDDPAAQPTDRQEK